MKIKESKTRWQIRLGKIIMNLDVDENWVFEKGKLRDI